MRINKKVDILFFTTAFTIFVRQTIRQGGIPFEITTRTDPFYNKENMKVLRQSIKEADEGKLTSHELIEELSRWWSRRIDDTNRLVYRIENNKIIISHCRTHYGDK